MRNFLAFVGATVVVVLGLGWYLGWYKVTPEKAGPGQSRLQVEINQDKIGEDVKYGAQKGAEKVQEFLKENRSASPDAAKDDKNLLPPTRPTGGQLQPPTTSDRNKPSPRAQEAFKGLILDGWFSSDKK